jgi:putative membrane protein
MMGMGGFGLIWMLLFWGVLILLAIWLVSLLFPAVKKSEPQENTPPSAVEILKERYARGELTREEYQQMVDAIRG